ncbi:MAG: outer rane efflux protein [Acidobacteriaceae bacterium]|nr:outer rane efflux protein [Acidobacteriaceae bacterium]
MFLSYFSSARRSLLIVSLALIVSSYAWTQDSQQPTQPVPQGNASAKPTAQEPVPVQGPQPQQFVLRDYSKPRPAFPNIIAPYRPQHIPPPNLTNTPRIEDLMQNGKIMLSMDDAVALALENNLDIGIARYNLNIADTDVLRAKSGANNFLGVNTGIVQNTPGGGVGGLSGSVGSGPGGTAPAAGGIGAGSNGLVSSSLGLGSLITSFDPILSGTLQEDRLRSLCTSPFCNLAGTTQNTGTANFSYLQGFQWGTNLSVGFTNSRTTSNNPFVTLSPNLNSGFRAEVTQHLFQGFGFLPNTRLIRLTKNNREITDVAFRLQTITTVDQIENMYWDLVYAYENVRVRQEELAFSQKTLSDNQKQVQIGSLAPIEVVRAQNTVATDQQALTQAQTNLDLQQLLMKNALSRNLQDARLADAEVIPTSTMQLPPQEAVIPTQDLVNDALGHRAELAESRIDLNNRQINDKAIRNALLPTLDLFAYYGGSGVGGDQNFAATCGNPGAPATGLCTQPGVIPTTSYGGTLNQLVDSSAPDKGVGVTLNIPLRNRQAQALQVRAVLEYRQAQMRAQQIENQIRIEVRNAQFSLTQNRAAVQAAQAAVELGRQSLESEQKKFNLGASTSTLVLQNQSAYATAQSNLVSAMAAYEKSHIELDRATGLLLDHAGILVSDAERGQVTHMPKVPYVAPRTDTVIPMQQQQPQQQQ